MKIPYNFIIMTEICDLNLNGYKIVQDEKHFRFGTDAVLLSHFCKINKGDKVADLCSGQGIIAVLLCAKTELATVDAVEILPELCEMAKESVRINNLSGRMFVHNGDINGISSVLGKAQYNKVVCNPPYKQMGGGILTEDKARLLALHESSCTLSDVIRNGAELLKFSGKMFICQRPARLCDITVLAREKGMEVKRIRFVHPYKDAKPSLVLCELQKGAKPEVVIEPPLILYESKNTYSEEYKNIMGYE